MAKIGELNDSWYEWVKTRPECIRVLCERFTPDRLYRLKSTGSRVTIYSYSEDNTLTVDITGDYNAHMMDRRVFGINPDDLEECDLPAEDEILGAVLTDDADIEAFVDMVRPAILEARGIKPKSKH